MEKSKFEQELGEVPPIPLDLFEQVIEKSNARVLHFPTKIVAALLIIGVTAALYLQLGSGHGEESIMMVQVESVSYIYETYSDNYDLLSDL